jgi:hypothetical protein
MTADTSKTSASLFKRHGANTIITDLPHLEQSVESSTKSMSHLDKAN